MPISAPLRAMPQKKDGIVKQEVTENGVAQQYSPPSDIIISFSTVKVKTTKVTLPFTTEPTAKKGEEIRGKGHLLLTSILQKEHIINGIYKDLRRIF